MSTFLNYRFAADIIETEGDIWEKYDKIEEIGEGGFGIVYSAKVKKSNNTVYAVK